MKIEIKLNPYRITWLAFVPKTGKNVVTLKDQILIKRGKSFLRRGAEVIFQHYASPEKANEVINRLAGHLSKEYSVYEFTDKQYGMLKFGQDFREVLTTKQKENVCGL